MQKFLFAVIAILIGLQPAVMRGADAPADPAVRQIESFYSALLDTMKRGEQLGLLQVNRLVGVSVKEETTKPAEAYAGMSRPTPVAYREGWLP